MDITRSLKKIRLNELEQLAPDLYTWYNENREIDEDDEENDEYDDDDSDLLYFDSDIHLDPLQYQRLKDDYGFYTPWVVNGDLVLDGVGFGGSALVKGDLVCDSFGYGDWVLVQGKIVARYFATFIAEDHEMLVPTVSLRLETPYVFAWFYNLQHVQLGAGTPVFIICDGSDLNKMNLLDPYFYWKEWAFVLRPELSYTIESDYSDAIHWNFMAIETALKKGESLFIEGFDPQCMPLYRQAHRLLSQKNYAESFKVARQAAALSPGFYYPCLYMGSCLYNSAAFEQAIPVLRQAVRLFPEKQKNLVNQAAGQLAQAALRLHQLDMAIEWSSFSIECTRNNHDDGARQWHPYRVRGEAYLMAGNLEAARADLEAAVNMNFQKGVAHWLLGLVYHRLGRAKEADKHQKLAVKLDDRLSASYETHADASFLTALATTVDWA